MITREKERASGRETVRKSTIKQGQRKHCTKAVAVATTAKNDGLSNGIILYDSRDNVGSIHIV